MFYLKYFNPRVEHVYQTCVKHIKIYMLNICVFLHMLNICLTSVVLNVCLTRGHFSCLRIELQG